MARVVKISSWVMPSTMAVPLRSLSRNISSPMTASRPLFSQIDAGCMDGSRNSWPPMAFISSRMIAMTLARTRIPSGSRL